MALRKLHPLGWFNHEDGGGAAPARREDATPRDAFHSEVDRMFDNFFTSFFNGMPALAKQGDTMLRPSLDLSATDKEYEVSVELPGVDKKEINIEVKAGALVISGEKKHEAEDRDEKKGVYRIERSYGTFSRTLTLPDDVDIDGISAKFDKGVLHVTIPRTEAKGTRKIAIS